MPISANTILSHLEGKAEKVEMEAEASGVGLSTFMTMKRK
jgi:hypothetical protein